MTRRPVPLTVVVCTRDRPDDLQRCLESLLRLDPEPLEVVVVDQGSVHHQPVRHRMIRYQPTIDRGLSRARNLGCALARADVVAFLDDDCTVGPTWAGDIAALFERHPDAGLAFGSVVAGAPAGDMYVPAYSVFRERRLKGRLSARHAHGIGAAMYLRASVVAEVGVFDTRLGAGGDFRSSEDWDFTFRALAAGVVVVETPLVSVEHYGARPYSDGSAAQLLRWNAFSHGAVHAKLLRCGDPIAIVLMLTEVASLGALARPLNAFRRRPTNLGRAAMYCRGILAGLRAPVRRKERLFEKVAVQPAP